MPFLARLWVQISAALVGGGWILSALHELNRAGYTIVFALAIAGCFYCWQSNRRPMPPNPPRLWLKWKRRFQRPAPLMFLLIFLLSAAGGLLNPPGNGDSNAYRIPRVLHWLANEGWQWIHTGDSRMNIAGCGYEWLYAPLILFTKTDRWVFLPNLINFVLLPGLIFSVLRQLRISPRVAWWWMWILASGWCYALQADSTLNDSLGTAYALAAVDFALRAGKSGRVGDLWLSLIAAALLTGIKQTNLPLLLPWAIAVWPAASLAWKRPVLSTGVMGLAVLVSVAPLAYLNWVHTGTWSGFPKDGTNQIWAWGSHQELTSPFWGLVGNLFALSAQNLLPLFFPKADAWNNAMQHFLQTPLGSHFTQFEVFGRLGRSVSEASAGIGLGVIALAVISVLAGRFLWRGSGAQARTSVNWHFRLLYYAPWLALLVFMAKVGTYQNARQAAPYYVLLFPLILGSGHWLWLARQRWWRLATVLVLLVTTAYIGFVRGRTWLPAPMAASLQEKYPHSKWVRIFGDFYAARNAVAAMRGYLDHGPAAQETIVGFATTCSGAEPGWWLPFGRRQVERVLPNDNTSTFPQRGIHYIIVEDVYLQPAGQTIDQWAAQHNGDLIDQLAITKDPNSPQGHLYLVHLRELSAAPSTNTVQPPAAGTTNGLQSNPTPALGE